MSDATAATALAGPSAAPMPAGMAMETMQQGFWRSCNPIFAQLALRTGVSRFYYIYPGLLASGTRPASTCRVKKRGILHQYPTEIDMATSSYGESSTVTPIQLATAYCVFANGGNLVQPSDRQGHHRQRRQHCPGNPAGNHPQGPVGKHSRPDPRTAEGRRPLWHRFRCLCRRLCRRRQDQHLDRRQWRPHSCLLPASPRPTIRKSSRWSC